MMIIWEMYFVCGFTYSRIFNYLTMKQIPDDLRFPTNLTSYCLLPCVLFHIIIIIIITIRIIIIIAILLIII